MSLVVWIGDIVGSLSEMKIGGKEERSGGVEVDCLMNAVDWNAPRGQDKLTLDSKLPSLTLTADPRNNHL